MKCCNINCKGCSENNVDNCSALFELGAKLCTDFKPEKKETTPENEFKWGEEVEVSNSLKFGTTYFNGILRGICPKTGGYVVMDYDRPSIWLYCRKKLPHFDVDDKVLIKYNHQWKPSHFSHYDEKRKPCCFQGGRTSWTTTETVTWDEIKKGE